MFGNAPKPSRIWSFGAKAPTTNIDMVASQMRDAHRYRNALVEIELRRRAAVDAALRDLSPDLVEIEASIAAKLAELEAARDRIRQARMVERTRHARPPADAQEAKAAVAALRALRARRKEARAAIFGLQASGIAPNPRWAARQDAINAADSVARKALRADYSARVAWGTRAVVEQGMSDCRSGPPPRYHRWEGDGHLAVQFIDHAASGGNSAPRFAELLGGTDTRVQIVPWAEDRVRTVNGLEIRTKAVTSDGRMRAIVRFRIGSEGRKPVWAEIPVTLHREPPADARVTWVHLIRRRIACTCEWRVQFVLARDSWARPDCAPAGTVGIDVGWRIHRTGPLRGRMRVAYWRDDRGHEGELTLPTDWLGEMRRVEGIQSERDLEFNAARDAMAAWLRAGVDVPAWMLAHEMREGEEDRWPVKALHQWRSQGRLAALAIRWRREDPAWADMAMRPSAADMTDVGAAYRRLEMWRKRDRHLYEYQGNLRDQLQRRREDAYRVFAAEMRRRYRTAKLEKLDLRDFHILPFPEEGAPDDIVRRHTRDACLSELMKCICESMAETIEVEPALTTMTCRECGHVQTLTVPERREPIVTCPECERAEDQDSRAGGNILASDAVAVE